MTPVHQTKPPVPAEPQVSAPRRLDSAGLFAGLCEVVIVHQGKEYRLRITRQEKLILTK